MIHFGFRLVIKPIIRPTPRPNSHKPNNNPSSNISIISILFSLVLGFILLQREHWLKDRQIQNSFHLIQFRQLPLEVGDNIHIFLHVGFV